MERKILPMAVLLLLLIPIAAAFDFDNIKVYNHHKKEVTIKNIFGLGEDVSKLKLLSPEKVYVLAGEDRKIAEIQLEKIKPAYSKAFRKVSFYDLNKNMQEIEREFTLKYKKVSGQKKVNDYTWTCEEMTNKSLKCYNKLTGFHYEDTYEWIEFADYDELPENTTVIGIFTDVNSGDYIEWIPTFFGVEIDEWAAFVGTEKVEGYFIGSTGASSVTPTSNRSQTFTIGTTGSYNYFNLVGVQIEAYKTSAPSDLRVCIYDTNGTTPRNQLVCNSSIDETEFAASAGYAMNISFEGTAGLNFTPGTTYALVLSEDSEYDIAWRYNTSGDYTGGEAWKYVEGEGEWSRMSYDDYTMDFMFEIYGNISPPPQIPGVYDEYYPTNSYIGLQEEFGINITNITLETPPTNGIFYFDGMKHNVSITHLEGSNWSLNRTILINSTGIKNFSFSYDIDSQNFNTTLRWMTVNPILLDLCNSTLNVPFLNFTFEDESDNSKINATIESATFYFWLGADRTLNSTLNFADSGQNYSYAFCFLPSYKTVNIDTTIQYDASGYVQRNYHLAGNFTNSTSDITLYLLSETDGLYVTYQVVSGSNQPIPDVFTNVTRTIGGTEVLVGSGTTGDDGGVTFWLNPDYSHTLTFEKEGYEKLILTHVPTQPTYTVELSSISTVSDVSDYSRGISYSIEPVNKTLTNGSDYDFKFTISSSYWALDEYGFILKNSTGAVLGSDSGSNSAGGETSATINTANHTNIIMEYYWYTNLTYSNGSTSWYVTNNVDYGYSIWTFFIHLKTYTTSGMFGLNVWSRTLIIFLIIFGLTGAISYYSGLTSPAAVLMELFVLVAFFDVGLSLVPSPIGAVSHFPTIFVGLILTGYLIQEWYR